MRGHEGNFTFTGKPRHVTIEELGVCRDDIGAGGTRKFGLEDVCLVLERELVCALNSRARSSQLKDQEVVLPIQSKH